MKEIYGLTFQEFAQKLAENLREQQERKERKKREMPKRRKLYYNLLKVTLFCFRWATRAIRVTYHFCIWYPDYLLQRKRTKMVKPD